MPAKPMSFSQENAGRQMYPRFKLDKGEKGRIVVIDEQPQMDMIHFVKGSGYLSCLGDHATVLQVDTDPEHCPFCVYSQPGRDNDVGMPYRRFVMHVLAYNLKSQRGYEPADPISVNVLSWFFGDEKFNWLIGARDMYKDLRKRDIQIECRDKTYDKWDMQVDGTREAFYLKDKATGMRIVSQFRTEMHKDIGRLLGRTMTLQASQALVDKLFGNERRNIPRDVAESEADDLLNSLNTDTAAAVSVATTDEPQFGPEIIDMDELLK